MDISVITATYNRAELLDNALQTYSKQKLANHLTWEYILVDDASTDDTKEVAERWSKKLPIRYITSEELGLPKDPAVWRDGCPLINRASTIAQGKFLILTHPEIMVPADALASMYHTGMRSGEERWWVTAIPYWMPEGPLPKGWKTDLAAISNMPGFYDPSWPDYPMQIDYRNQNQEIRNTWESWVFNGIRTRDWRWFGGFQEFKQWGSVDIDQVNRRNAAGIKTVFASSLSPNGPHRNGYLMVYHQAHASKRDGDLALQGVRGKAYPDAEAARKAGGLYPIYHHGPRERASTPGTLQGILGDHLSRYEFAARYCNGKDVLDAPCGTGYGSMVLQDFRSYNGIDIDHESIEYAAQHYNSKPNVAFRVGDLQGLIDVPDESVDLFLCFEGIEHVRWQGMAVEEMYRVLRHGGTFILSTPNPNNTPGTYWDKHMLYPPELFALFDDGRWINLDQFHQPSYSIDEAPVRHGYNKDAQIQILGGTKK